MTAGTLDELAQREIRNRSVVGLASVPFFLFASGLSAKTAYDLRLEELSQATTLTYVAAVSAVAGVGMIVSAYRGLQRAYEDPA